MNIQNRTWRPDTCACVITMEMDTDTQVDYLPVLSYTDKNGVESKMAFCSIHANKDIQAGYDACLKTNQTKNQLEGVFNSVGATKRVLTPSEQDLLKLVAVASGQAMSFETAQAPAEIRDKEYKWSINQKGEVEIDLSNFSAQEKATIEAEIKNNLTNVVVK